MLKFALIAIHLVSGNPESYVLDHELTIEDCGQAIEAIQTKRMVWLDERNAVPVKQVTLACELQK